MAVVKNFIDDLAILVCVFLLVINILHSIEKSNVNTYKENIASGYYMKCGDTKWKYMKTKVLYGNDFHDRKAFCNWQEARQACINLGGKR